MRSLRWFRIVSLALVACDEAPLSTGSIASTTATSAGAGGTGGVGGAGGAPAADPQSLRAGPPLSPGRTHHTATLLRDGRVLVVGGEGPSAAPIANVDLFDPVTETFAAAAPLDAPREFHSATLLLDGRVLIAGGGLDSQIGIPSGQGVLKSAILFDPESGSYTAAGDMNNARAGHQAALLSDGRVLLVGGATDIVGGTCTVIPNCTTGKALASAEVFDPSRADVSWWWGVAPRRPS